MIDIKKRVYFVNHNNKRILIQDMSNCQPEEGIKIMEYTSTLTQIEPENSVLVLTNVQNGKFNKAFVNKANYYSELDKPYIKKWALVGIDGLKNVILTTVSRLTKREYNLFKTEEDAKDWLAQD